MANSNFVDGKTTAGGSAAKVKDNLQMAESHKKQQLDQLVLQQIMSVPDVHKAIFPARVYNLIYAKYSEGKTYGWHIDSPIMMAQQPVRTDVAMTIFLSNPEDYEGGELEVQGAGGIGKWKPAAGDAVFYPANMLHRVAPVTKGERQVIVTWLQSAVRDPQHRQMLYDLKRAHEEVEANPEMAATAEKILHTFSNLLREWAEV